MYCNICKYFLPLFNSLFQVFLFCANWNCRFLENCPADLNLWEMQHCLLIRDDIKIHSLPHSMSQEATHVPLPGDDDQVHPCAVKAVYHWLQKHSQLSTDSILLFHNGNYLQPAEWFPWRHILVWWLQREEHLFYLWKHHNDYKVGYVR